MPQINFDISLKCGGNAEYDVKTLFPKITRFLSQFLRKALMKQIVLPNRIICRIPFQGQKVRRKRAIIVQSQLISNLSFR